MPLRASAVLLGMYNAKRCLNPFCVSLGQSPQADVRDIDTLPRRWRLHASHQPIVEHLARRNKLSWTLCTVSLAKKKTVMRRMESTALRSHLFLRLVLGSFQIPENTARETCIIAVRGWSASQAWRRRVSQSRSLTMQNVFTLYGEALADTKIKIASSATPIRFPRYHLTDKYENPQQKKKSRHSDTKLALILSFSVAPFAGRSQSCACGIDSTPSQLKCCLRARTYCFCVGNC